MTRKAAIYGVKTGDTYHYIGKTVKLNAEGDIPPSNITNQYCNPELRNVFQSHEDIQIEQLELVPEGEWWDEKLKEVIEKHKDEHPLLNAQWMKDGKRGICYWEGKKRDPHTLQCLSESKYRKFVQYDADGRLKKIWNSGKEAAIEVFKDYELKNGGGYSRLYEITKSYTIDTRFMHDSYWFSENELIEYFGVVPNKIHPDNIRKHERERVSKAISEAMAKRTHSSQYSVLKFSRKGKLLKTYGNAEQAANDLGIAAIYVRRLCKGTRKGKNLPYTLKYGEKTLQPIIKKKK